MKNRIVYGKQCGFFISNQLQLLETLNFLRYTIG